MNNSEFEELIHNWLKLYSLLKNEMPSFDWKISQIEIFNQVHYYLEIIQYDNFNVHNNVNNDDNKNEDSLNDSECEIDQDVSIISTNYNSNRESNIHILLHPNYQIPCPYFFTINSNLTNNNLIIQDEHPLFGIPAYTIHPCGLEERLNIYNELNLQQSSLYLLNWFTLVGPLFHLSISPEFYLQAQIILNKKSN